MKRKADMARTMLSGILLSMGESSIVITDNRWGYMGVLS